MLEASWLPLVCVPILLVHLELFPDVYLTVESAPRLKDSSKRDRAAAGFKELCGKEALKALRTQTTHAPNAVERQTQNIMYSI